MAAPTKEETIPVRIALPKNQYAYLRVLKVRTTLGASEADIAKYLLGQQIEKMLEEKYHDTHSVPTA